MIKKYCKNCKYSGFMICKTGKPKRIKSDPFTGATRTVGRVWKDDLNKDGDCEKYEVKWWKIWVAKKPKV